MAQPLPLAQMSHEHVGDEVCPLCEQPVPHQERERIRAREAQRQKEAAARLQEQFQRQRAQDEAKAKAELERLRLEGDQRLREMARQLEAREAAAAAAIADIRREQAESEARVRAEAAVTAEAAAREKILAAENARLSAEASLNEKLQELQAQREAQEKAHARSLNDEKAKAFEEKLRLEEKLQDVQRQLQKKSTDELGEGAEIDLFEQLKSEFPEDQVRRIAKGEAGADTVQEVYHNGRLCGRILYESKNSTRWYNDYVAKLRQDQLKIGAEHAILSTHKLPADTRQVHLQDTVIVCQPARVLALAQILRRHVVQMHQLRLSNEERSHKSEALYDFITSPRCSQYLDDLKAHTEALEEIDVKEKKAHETVWKRRGEVIRKAQRVQGDLVADIERITGTGGEPLLELSPPGPAPAQDNPSLTE